MTVTIDDAMCDGKEASGSSLTLVVDVIVVAAEITKASATTLEVAMVIGGGAVDDRVRAMISSVADVGDERATISSSLAAVDDDGATVRFFVNGDSISDLSLVRTPALAVRVSSSLLAALVASAKGGCVSLVMAERGCM
ncbi:unnamed protein product [Linum trigynum]|uniref:Uncharacterized protein n=1 Tax=Linum trigynum TaxID=586398 RepID=A0AAV2ET46_9ROSI